jgi:hypothetical protein
VVVNAAGLQAQALGPQFSGLAVRRSASHYAKGNYSVSLAAPFSRPTAPEAATGVHAGPAADEVWSRDAVVESDLAVNLARAGVLRRSAALSGLVDEASQPSHAGDSAQTARLGGPDFVVRQGPCRSRGRRAGQPVWYRVVLLDGVAGDRQAAVAVLAQ